MVESSLALKKINFIFEVFHAFHKFLLILSLFFLNDLVDNEAKSLVIINHK